MSEANGHNIDVAANPNADKINFALRELFKRFKKSKLPTADALVTLAAGYHNILRAQKTDQDKNDIRGEFVRLLKLMDPDFPVLNITKIEIEGKK